MEFDTLIRMMAYKKASDVYITAGAAPAMKMNGKVVLVDNKALTPDDSENMVLSIMNDKQKEEFIEHKECNFAIDAKHLGRYRISAFHQCNHKGMVLRRIETKIPTVEELELPQVIKKLSLVSRGLIIFVGATGSGKSSSLASMIGYRNAHKTGHIISIEDPIEFVHKHDGCIITQREVGLDTESFETALKNSLRQAPDVIQIGEIRSQDTMEMALAFAETGHLCLATLHANNANQALERIVSFFPPEKHEQIYLNLSLNLHAILAQQLIPRCDKAGRIVCVEVMLNTPVIAEHIRKGQVDTLKEFMERATDVDIQTFDQALFRLYVQGKISYENALHYADSENNLRLMIKLREDNGDKTPASSASLKKPNKPNPGFTLTDD